MTDYGLSSIRYPSAGELATDIGKVTVLAIAYLATARLGLMLAVPPGYASAIFPASGIALAGVLILGYRSWPGVFLGSLLLNVSVTVDTTTAPLWDALLLGCGIGVGASLQAVTGAYLIRRFSVFPVPFSDWRKVVTFLFWGGPIGCLVNAFAGVSVLVAGSRIPPENFFYNAANWWIGDTFGVLIFAPVILMWAFPGSRLPANKRVIATVPAALTFVLAVFIGWHASSWERGRIQLQFDRLATFLALAFEKSLYGNMVAVGSLQSFVNTVAVVDHDRFHAFAQGVLASHSGIQALSWNPAVVEEERDEFEAEIRRQEHPSFQISERSQTGQLRPAGQRGQYVVVRFIEPHDGNEYALGYDIASDPVRNQALTLARQTGRPAATEPIDLVQEEGQDTGVLVVAPAYAQPAMPGMAAPDRADLRGYVVGVLRMHEVVRDAFGELDTQGVVIKLIDERATGGRQTLYESATSVMGVPILRDRGLLGGANTLAYTYTQEFGGRLWSLQLSPTQEYIARHRPENAWMILSGGLLISALVVAFTVVLVGRQDALAELIDELTAAKADAVRANDAKSDFLAAMSHDLRTPLNAILGFSEVMKDRIFGDMGNPRYAAYAEDIHQSGQFLLNLVDDVLDTSKIEAGKYQLCEEVVDIPNLVADCVHMTGPMAEQSKVRLIVDCPDSLAPLRCDRRVVAQTLNNLLSNAVKFSHEGGSVRISAQSNEDGAVTVKISDTGIGMSENEKVRALEPFRQTRRIHAKQGTGLGLYLCDRFMELHGGALHIRSRKGSGTTVLLRFPPERAAPVS